MILSVSSSTSVSPIATASPSCLSQRDTVASVIYKQYQAGFYGLSTAGNVVLFALIAILVVPLTILLNRKEGHE